MTRYVGKRRYWVLACLGVATTFALLPALTGAAATKTALKGSLTTQSVSGPSCTSAVNVCFTGTIDGKLKGALTGTGTAIIASADTPTTGVVFLTSDVTIETATGDLLLKEAASLRTTGTGEYSAIWTVISGTGAYAGATGAIQVTGNVVIGSAGAATYVGTLELAPS